MNQYYELLMKLLTETSLTITTDITDANLRKGLKVALADHNDAQAIMEFDLEERVVRVNTLAKLEDGTYKYKVSLVAKDSPRQGSFTFQVVE